MRSWLKRIRGQRTQGEVSIAIGISQGYYSDIENNRKTPMPPLAKRIATVLGFEWTKFYADDVVTDCKVHISA